MSPVNTLIFGVLLFVILCLTGYAIIVLFRFKADPIEMFALSPVVGLAFLTLLTTYLTLLNIPFGLVSKTIMLIIVVLSTTYLVIMFRKNLIRGELVQFQFIVPLIATFGLIALPFLIGGYQFAILRGNGTDSFNYVSIANALSRYPLDWILTQPESILRGHSPNLVFAQEMLTSRWSTSALLAFTSGVFGTSPIEFEYVFTLVMMVIFISALLAALSAIGVLNKLTIWLPVVFVVGFWGQFILDLRAFSHIVSLPFIPVLVGWLLSMKTNYSGSLFRYGAPLTAIMTVALFFQYQEIVIVLLPGTILLLLINLWGRYKNRTLTRSDYRKLFTFLLIFILLFAPLFKFLLNFAIGQVKFAYNISLGWEMAYFTWMENPVRGLWGVGINTGFIEYLDGVFSWFTFIIAMVLSLGFGFRLLMILFSRKQLTENKTEAGLFLLCATGLIEAGILLSRGNAWAAGKILSYFVFLVPIWLAIYLAKNKSNVFNSGFRRATSMILILAIFGWGAVNLVYAGSRIIHAIKESDFPGYMTNHGFYQRVNADVITLMQDNNLPKGSTITIFDPSLWGREFLMHYVEGNGYSAHTPGFSGSRVIEPDVNDTNTEVEIVLANRRYLDSDKQPLGENSILDFTAIDPGEHFAAVVAFEGGYGMEIFLKTSRQYIWTGEQDIRITLFATSVRYNVSLRLCPGEVRESDDALLVFIEVDGNQLSQYEVKECTDIDVELVGDSEKNFNQIRISSIDPYHGPTILGQDPRDLRLRVELYQIRLKDSIH